MILPFRLSIDLEAAVGCDMVNVDTISLDVAELLDRFVKFRSFSALSHGGGRESNMQYMALLILLVQYLRKVSTNTEPGEAHSFMHQISISLMIDTAEQWNAKRVDLLKGLQEEYDRNWENAKSALLGWTVVDHYQNKILQVKLFAEKIDYFGPKRSCRKEILEQNSNVSTFSPKLSYFSVSSKFLGNFSWLNFPSLF